MSYSFSVTADAKADAKQKIAENFDNIVNGQPSHAADRDAVVAASNAFVDLLSDPPEGQEIYVNVYGSLGWDHQVGPGPFLSASASINASLRNKQT